MYIQSHKKDNHIFSWCPDGKLLAAGYSSGLLAIRHIESPEVRIFSSTANHTLFRVGMDFKCQIEKNFDPGFS